MLGQKYQALEDKRLLLAKQLSSNGLVGDMRTQKRQLPRLTTLYHIHTVQYVSPLCRWTPTDSPERTAHHVDRNQFGIP